MPHGQTLVELVTPQGITTQTAEKLAAHQPPGRLHRAFSVLLFSENGEMLLQRRARGKYHSPGVWSNSCCGHPLPEEAPFLAAVRRTVQELGVAPRILSEAGTVSYCLTDPDSGLVEKEYNHLFVGFLGAEPHPDPAEVAETTLVSAPALREWRDRKVFSVWFDVVLEAARPTIRDLVDAARW